MKLLVRILLLYVCILGVFGPGFVIQIFFDFSLTVKEAPHECVIRTGQH